MEASHKTHRPHIKVGKHEEEEEEEDQIVSELRPSEPIIILLADSRDLDNAARRING